MSEKYMTINIIIESGRVVDLDVVTDGNRTEYAAWGVDDPMTETEAIKAIAEAIKESINKTIES